MEPPRVAHALAAQQRKDERMAGPDDRLSEGERQRGSSVLSDPEKSRWHGGDANPLDASSRDDDPGGWNGGHDTGAGRAAEGDAELTGWSGDSVRTQGIESATSSSLGSQGAGATTGGRSAPRQRRDD